MDRLSLLTNPGLVVGHRVGDRCLIVIGADTHKRTHCCAGVRLHAGEPVEVREAPVRSAGFGELLRRVCDLGSQRTWAIEGCRHVSGAFERFLIDAR